MAVDPELVEEVGQLVMEDFSKEQAEKVGKWACQSEDHAGALIQLVIESDVPVAKRAAWSLGGLGEHKAEVLNPHMALMHKGLQNPSHDAVARAIFRSLSMMDIPEDWRGEFLDQAFGYMQNPQNNPAVRVFAMQTAYNLSLPFPELLDELLMVLEQHYDEGSAGFKNRAGKLMAKIRKSR